MYSVLHSTQYSGQPNQANGSTNPNCCLGTILATRTLYTILATRNLCYLVMATLAIMFPKSAPYEKDRVWIRLGHFGRLQPILWSNCQKPKNTLVLYNVTFTHLFLYLRFLKSTKRFQWSFSVPTTHQGSRFENFTYKYI